MLLNLGLIHQPLLLTDEDHLPPLKTLTGIAPEWVTLCQRWRATSTLARTTIQGLYYSLLKAGRWLAVTHPDVVSPAQWTRELAVEFVAAIDHMTVGEFSTVPDHHRDRLGKPLSARAKAREIWDLRKFFQDCIAWGWIPSRFDPERCFAVPRTVVAQVWPSPRVIDDALWAKLLWAGLNLTPEDLPRPDSQAEPGACLSDKPIYPFEMVRAIAVVWLFSGLRNDEIRRLRVGCIR